jgi:hypothetical protein
MKKLFLIVICAVMALALAACGGQKANSDPTASGQEQTGSLGGAQIPNPFIDCKTLEEAQDIAGFDIALPGSMPEGYSMSPIRAVKDTMIEIIYQSGSDEIRIRKGVGSEDISGAYNEFSETGTVTVGGLQVAMKGDGGKVNVASWFDGGHAFSITVNLGGEGIGEDVVSGMVSAVK